LSPEELFEGGATTYNNWVEFGFGGFLTRGNQAQAEQQHRVSEGVFGGLQDLHYRTDVGTNGTTLTLDGRALFDQRDYKLQLDVTRPDLGFVRVGYEQFRTWYNGEGGYYRPADVWYPLSDDALGLDRGEFTFETGLTLGEIPEDHVPILAPVPRRRERLDKLGPDASGTFIARARHQSGVLRPG